MRCKTLGRAGIQRRILLALPIAVVLAACGSAGSPSAATSVFNQGSPHRAPLASGRIMGAEFSAGVDRSGRATLPTDFFKVTADRTVYLVIRFADLPAGSKVSYVRSLDGKFVDARSILTRPGTRLVYFQWSAESGHSLTQGRYLVRVYLNGSRAWEGRYSVT